MKTLKSRWAVGTHGSRKLIVCKECGKTKPHAGRNLCWGCYGNIDILLKHKPTGRPQSEVYGISCTSMVIPDPPFPMATDDRERRITVMRRRALAGYGVFHPDDSKSPDWFRWIDSINQRMDEASYGDD